MTYDIIIKLLVFMDVYEKSLLYFQFFGSHKQDTTYRKMYFKTILLIQLIAVFIFQTGKYIWVKTASN